MKRLMEKASKKKNKSKWRPRVGKRYYYPSVDIGTPYAEPGTWSGIRRLEADRYNAGMICRTKKEALELAQKMLAVAKDTPLTAHRHVYDNGRIKCPKCSKQFIWGYYDSEAYDEIHHCPYCGQRINVVDTEE